MGANDILVFRAPATIDAMGGLLTRMKDDKGLRKMFARGPVGVIAKEVFPDQKPATAEITRGNRLLYSLLSNDAFMEWADKYERDLMTKALDATQMDDPGEALRSYLAITDRTAIHQDLASAVAQFADPELIASLTWRPDTPRIGAARLPVMADVAVDIETFVYAVAAVAVFAVAVAAVFIGAVAENDRLITRLDVRAVANGLADELTARSLILREKGTLIDFSRRNAGFIR